MYREGNNDSMTDKPDDVAEWKRRAAFLTDVWRLISDPTGRYKDWTKAEREKLELMWLPVEPE